MSPADSVLTESRASSLIMLIFCPLIEPPSTIGVDFLTGESNLLVMSYENNGGFETLVDKFKERNNLFGVPAVKIPSRFIGQNNSGAADQTPGDSDALLFASGKLIGKSFLLIGDAERLDDFLKIIFIRYAPVQEQGQTYVLAHVNVRD